MIVDQYIAKQKSPQREVCQQLREVIFNTIPNIREEMKWGVPTYGEGKFYIVALKDHVNLGFSMKGLSEDEQEHFDGSGKTMKVIEVRSINEINRFRIVELLKLVWDRPQISE
jgi:uncharacterized protein YdhG (YjbR/CyaY superfamily)